MVDNADNAGTLETDSTDEAPAETTEPSPFDKLEQRIAQLETSNRAQLAQLSTAVGRVQSLTERLEKTGDARVEQKLRQEMAVVSDLLGSVADGIDPAILSPDVKRRVADARDNARRAAEKADIDQRVAAQIADITKPRQAPDTEAWSKAIEEVVVSGIKDRGLNPDDPAFDWNRASTLLHTQGVPALMTYIQSVTKTLEDAVGPKAKPKASPASAGASTPRSEMEEFLDPKTPLARKLELGKAAGLAF